jgi:hypothetical protein
VEASATAGAGGFDDGRGAAVSVARQDIDFGQRQIITTADVVHHLIERTRFHLLAAVHGEHDAVRIPVRAKVHGAGQEQRQQRAAGTAENAAGGNENQGQGGQ